MSSALMVDRGTLGGIGFAPAAGPATLPGATPANSWCVVPRCEVTFEKCKGGLKIWCKCDDEMAVATLQNLCRMLAGGLCSCCCTLNGTTICQCNLACGICKCENTDDGVCITCTSGDKACCDMLQACCDCLAACNAAGCCCYVCLNGTPVCCSVC